ncbi:MFS transporter [Streptomyces caniferus]
MRKIFKRVVPLFFVMFVANYVDRVNIGFVHDQLRADVGISAAAFGFGAGLFFLAYALFEVPGNLLMERFGARLWLTRIMITWGLVATAMAWVTSTEMFYVLRFLLGVVEAGFFPAVIYYFARWLPDADRGRATAIFLMGSGTAAVIAGPLSGALLEMHGLLGHRGWLGAPPGRRLGEDVLHRRRGLRTARPGRLPLPGRPAGGRHLAHRPGEDRSAVSSRRPPSASSRTPPARPAAGSSGCRWWASWPR